MFATARLGRLFVSPEYEVDIVCPIGHPVSKARAISAIYRQCFLARCGPSTRRLMQLTSNSRRRLGAPSEGL